MNLAEVMSALEEMGSEQTKKIYKNHGCKDPMFGVKIGDLKKLVKKIKLNHALGLQLFKTGNYDARYLAHYIVDPNKITKEILDQWINEADSYTLSEFAISPLASESPVALECIHDWMKQDEEHVKAASYAVYCNYISITSNEILDYNEIRYLLDIIKETIHNEKNRVRYTMNEFVICVGSYIPELTELALDTAEKIGKVQVPMGKTSCKVPNAVESITKIKKMNRLGKKRKKANI